MNRSTKNIIRDILIIIAAAAASWYMLSILLGCSKYEIDTTNKAPVTYQMVIDRYTLDTAIRFPGERYVQNLGSLSPDQAKKIDFTNDYWFIDCNLPDRLQQIYYTRCGKKIQPSCYPK